jgi:hypothetical protein
VGKLGLERDFRPERRTPMQEDVAGTQRAGTGADYATCAECGNVFIRRDARVEPAGLNDDSHSEYTELCAECEKLDRQGEQPIIPEPDR